MLICIRGWLYNELQLGPLTESSLTVDRVEVQWGVCSPSVVEVEEVGPRASWPVSTASWDPTSQPEVMV